MRNRGKQTNNNSGYTGVRWRERHQKWYAETWNEGKSIHLGCYDTREEAARARDKKVIELWEIVCPERQLNFPEEYND